MTENIMVTNFEPHERVILVQSTKIGTHEIKPSTIYDSIAKKSPEHKFWIKGISWKSG